MKMPQGWNRLKEKDKLIRDMISLSRGECGRIADLMQEMAEALEEASYRMKPCTEDEVDLVNQALKKFKEWQ